MHTASTTNGEPGGGPSPEKPATADAGKENIKEEPKSSKRTPNRILRYAEVQVYTVSCFIQHLPLTRISCSFDL